MGMKFGTTCQISPHQCNDKGIGPPKLKFLLIFDQNVEYIRPTDEYPRTIFRKFAEFVPRLGMRKLLKFRLICTRGYGVMAVLIRWGLVTPNLHSPVAAKLSQTPKRLGGARTCSRSSITVPSLVGLGFHPPPGWRKSEKRCLSVTLFQSVKLLNVSVCSPDFTMKTLEYRNVFMPLDRGRFVVVHPCSTFSDCRQLSTSLNAEVQKMAKIGVFRRQRTIG